MRNYKYASAKCAWIDKYDRVNMLYFFVHTDKAKPENFYPWNITDEDMF